MQVKEKPQTGMESQQRPLTEQPLRITLSEYCSKKPLIEELAYEEARVADTFGWDSVSAVRLPDVNKAIEKGDVTPASFDAQTTYGARGQGTFDTWKVARGGSGIILKMDVPIPNGILTFDGTDHPFEQALAKIEVQLAFVPRDPALAMQGKQDLQISTESAAAAGDEKPVSVLDLQFLGNPPNPLVPPFLRDVLEEWFKDHMQEFNHVFSTVSLGEVADREELQWLKPTTVSYAYVETNKLGPETDCFLAVLAMTEGRSDEGLSQQASPYIIPHGNRASFMISANRYLAKLLLPSMPDVFKDATVDDFNLLGMYLTNNKALKFDSASKAMEVGPGKFVATFDETGLTIKIESAHGVVSPGINLYLDYSMYLGAKLIDRPDGTKAFVLYDAKELDTSHVVEVASWVTWTEFAASMVASIILGVAGAGGGALVTKPLAQCILEGGEWAASTLVQKVVYALIRVTATVIGGAVMGAIGQSVNSISLIIKASAEGDAEKLPPFDPFADEVTAAIEWPQATQTVPTSVALNGGLLIGIDPNFID